jgi:GNAT superfamily N-acetyltransferase
MHVKSADSDADITRVFAVMRELRPHIASAEEFVSRVNRQRQTQPGWQLLYAEVDGSPVAAASYRIMEHLAWGKVLYVDDLICAESHRGSGAAQALMAFMEDRARSEDCGALHLDSGTQRTRAHHFYFRQGLSIGSFHFSKPL